MEKIGLPSVKEEKVEKNHSKFIIEPLFPGYGSTLGNSLRRVLLSSITGTAATSFKIEGISHEFTSIPHAREDVIEVMMNLKGISFKSHSDEPVVLELSKKGPTVVTAGDFKSNSKVEILNPEYVIINLDTKADFHMEVVVEKDRGFRPTEVAAGERKEIGRIGVDASFSPVVRVGISVEDTRVGQITNYDKLTVDVTTNGTVEPIYALREASKIIVDHLNILIEDQEFEAQYTEKVTPESQILEESFGGVDKDGEEDEAESEGKAKIEDLGLSQRTTNALLNSGVKSLAGLKRLTPLKIEEIKGLGKKGIEEINNVLNR